MSTLEQQNDTLTCPNLNFTLDLLCNDTDQLSVELEERRQIYKYAVPLMVFVCVASVIINAVILSTLYWIRRPLSPTLQISLYLTGADLYMSLVTGIGLILNSALPVIFDKKINQCFLLSFEAFRFGGMFTTMGHLLALSFNHYLGITSPLRYPFILTHRNILLGALFLWTVPTGSLLVYFSIQENDGFSAPGCPSKFMNRRKFRRASSNVFLLCLALMALIYFYIYLLVKRHQANRNRFRTGSTYLKNSQVSELRRSRREANSSSVLKSRNEKAFKTTFLIVSTVVVGWLPATVFYELVCEDCPISSNWGSTQWRILTNALINSCIIIKTVLNSYIYAARMQEIKTAMKRMRVSLRIKCCLGGRTRRERSLDFQNTEFSKQYLSRSSTRRISKRSILCRLQSLQGQNNGSLRTAPKDELNTQV